MRRIKYIHFAILFGYIGTNVASGSTFQFNSTANATYSIGAKDFEAFITTGTDTITVTLDNFLANPGSDTQEISGIKFTLAINDTNTDAISGTPTGQVITIASGGIYANGNATHPTIDHWETSNLGVVAGVTTVNLDVFKGGSPYDLIAGPPNASNLYSAANPSLTGHQPSIKGTATFVLSMTGITSSTQVTGVTFNVGTTTPQAVNAVYAAPEPQTFFLTLLALPLMLFLRRYRTGIAATSKS